MTEKHINCNNMFYNTTKLDNTRYDLSLLLSYKRQVSMVVGDRRVGKTFRVLRECVKVALKTHSLSFVWLRITKKESDEIKDTFFDDIIAYNVFCFKYCFNSCIVCYVCFRIHNTKCTYEYYRYKYQ